MFQSGKYDSIPSKKETEPLMAIDSPNNYTEREGEEFLD